MILQYLINLQTLWFIQFQKYPYFYLMKFYHFGEDANLIHRIDAETSGLIIVGKNKKSEIELKDMFQEKNIKIISCNRSRKDKRRDKKLIKV